MSEDTIPVLEESTILPGATFACNKSVTLGRRFSQAQPRPRNKGVTLGR